MNVKWLLERDIFQENLDQVQDAIRDQGMEYKICNYVPFEGDQQFLKLFDEKDCVVFYGSLQFARQVQRIAPWVPGVYCSLPNYECLYYYPRLGKYLLNENYVMIPFGELERRKDFLFSTLGEDDCLFVRPSSGFKIFTGKVTCRETWDKDLERFGFYDVTPETLVVAAKPYNLDGEWRLVVANGKIVAASQYRSDVGTKYRGGAPTEVLDYAQKVLDETKFAPDPVWCLDMCRTRAGDVKVLEIGGFSCAGLYMCDKAAVVKAVSEVALAEWEELYADVV